MSTSPTTNKRVQEWTVEDVAAWIKRVNLSVPCHEAIQENALDGNALCQIVDSDFPTFIWKDLGIYKTGDKLKIRGAVKTLLGT